MKRARDGQEAAHEEEHREHPEENVTESDQKSVTKETEPQEQSPKDESSENTKTQPETSSAKSGSAPPSTAPLPTVAHDGPPGTQPQQQQTLTPEEWAKMTPEQQQQYQMAIQQTMRYQQEMWMRMTPDQREQYSTWFQQQQQWAYYVSYMAQRSAAIAQQTAARLATLRPDPEAAPPPQFKQYEASAQFNSRTGRFQVGKTNNSSCIKSISILTVP